MTETRGVNFAMIVLGALLFTVPIDAQTGPDIGESSKSIADQQREALSKPQQEERADPAPRKETAPSESVPRVAGPGPNGLGVLVTLGLRGKLGQELVGKSHKMRTTRESVFGILVFYEFPLGESLKLGGELGGTVGGAENGQKLRLLDAGVWGRCILNPRDPFTFYVAGGAGVTLLTSKDGNFGGYDVDGEIIGTGFHFLGGGGFAYPVSKNTQLIGGLLYAVHRAKEMEGVDVDLVLEDVSVSNLQLTLGAIF
jgi:hypothetical protein